MTTKEVCIFAVISMQLYVLACAHLYRYAHVFGRKRATLYREHIVSSKIQRQNVIQVTGSS